MCLLSAVIMISILLAFVLFDLKMESGVEKNFRRRVKKIKSFCDVGIIIIGFFCVFMFRIILLLPLFIGWMIN